MSTLNLDLPRFYCFLRMEFLYNGQSHHGEHLKACVFGAASIYGRAIGFHVLTENCAVIWRLPIHMFCHKTSAPAMPLDHLQFWDCFSYEVTCTTFERLAESRCRVQLKSGDWEGGQYMFTIDWCGHEDAEEAGDGGDKCAHMIALDNGNFAAQPNHRIQWFCPAFVAPFDKRPDSVTNTSFWKVEREVETTSGYFYDSLDPAKSGGQVRLFAKGLHS